MSTTVSPDRAAAEDNLRNLVCATYKKRIPGWKDKLDGWVEQEARGLGVEAGRAFKELSRRGCSAHVLVVAFVAFRAGPEVDSFIGQV